MMRYRIDWSCLYEAEDDVDALKQMLADMDDIVRLRDGATIFRLSEVDMADDSIIYSSKMVDVSLFKQLLK